MIAISLSCKVCGMQINCETNDELINRCNNYKDNNWKSLRSEEHKQVDLFASYQTPGHSDFINNTEVRFIDKTDPLDLIRHKDFLTDILETCCPQELNNIDSYE